MVLLYLTKKLLGVQRKFDHPLQQFVGSVAREIVANQFFAKQAANIAQFAAFLFAGIYKVPMTIVDDNHIFFMIVPRAPYFARRPPIGIAGKPFIGFCAIGGLFHERIGDGDYLARG